MIKTASGQTWFSWKEKIRGMLWNAILARSPEFIINGQDFITNNRHLLWKVKILLWTIKINYESSRFFMNVCDMLRTFEIMNGWDFHDDTQFEIFMVIYRDFVMHGRDFHNNRSSFSWYQFEILVRTVEIFIMAGRDFHDDRLRFYYEPSRFSWWEVKIFSITG